MALGYCMSCGLLKAILPGAQKWGSREVAWRPVAHWNLIHVECGALCSERNSTPDGDVICPTCGPRDDAEFESTRCEGEHKDIK